VAAAVALRTLQIYEEDDILGQVRARAPQFARRISELAGHPLVGDARSVGLVGAIELMADGHRRIPFPPELKVGATVAQRALEQGLILRPLVDTISLCPPLIIRPAEVDFLFDVVGRALDQVAAELTGPARAAVV
jgi:4-aminobutyrate--pyruvate transaminase